MGVAGYILKPIQDEQLTETLQKVFSRIDDERHRRRWTRISPRWRRTAGFSL